MGMGRSKSVTKPEVFSSHWLSQVDMLTQEVIIPPSVDPTKRSLRIIGDEGAKVFATYFANNGKIKELTIDGPCLAKGENTFMTVVGFQALEECLSRDFVLEKLHFTGHEITSEIGKVLAEGLADNHQLTSISFWKNLIEDETAIEIVKLLKDKERLALLDLGENKITENGKEKIEALVRETKVKVTIF